MSRNRSFGMKSSELGPRQHCCDNGTMFSILKMVDDCLMSIFGVATPFRHRSLKILCFIIIFLFVSDALIRCRIFALSLSRS